jgi:hypothetical protein
METNPKKCVIIVDFTKWGMVVDGNVHCFVMCVLFGEANEKKTTGMLFYMSSFSHLKEPNGSRRSNILISLRKAPKKAKFGKSFLLLRFVIPRFLSHTI